MQVAPARRLHPGIRLLLAALRLYQRWLSPLMPASCRFYPTCSHYANEAIERHGAVRGLGLTLWRLLRCQPLTRGGFDPVPAPGCASRDRRAAACEPAEGRP